jgi:Tol biopolymer transport system component/putative hemolysin
MKLAHLAWFTTLLLVGAVLVSCGTTPAPAATAAPTATSTPVATSTPAATATPATYTDPFAYCAVVGTVDTPGSDYVGPQVPESVARGLQQALNAPDTPIEVLENGSFWRCMDGSVYACFVGANLPCQAKANTDRTPTQEEIDYCQQNPNSDFIPAVVTGRETVFEWRCRDGAPEIVQQVSQPDAQGFLSEIWYKIGPTEAAPGMPSPASKFCVDQGYRSEIRDEAGGQVGYCLFPDGSECEEWAFYHGECAPASEGQATPGQLANPASENCIEQGGTVSIQTRSDGGQYGICLFEDNRQCEEWALLRGDCPVGGLKVTGYVTPAAVYCAITGGEYAITGNSGAENEQGTCTFNDGSQCDAWEYYDGKCAPGSAPIGTAGLIIQPLPEEVCNGQAQAMSHALADLIPTQSEEPLDDWVTGATGIGCQVTITGTGVQFESPAAVVYALGSMLGEEDWTADPMLVADGPTGTAAGYRKGDQICMAAAMWQADDSANCPQDQPISACPVKPEQQNYTVTLNCGVATAEGQTIAEAGSGQLVFDSTRGGVYRDLYVMPAPGSQAQVTGDDYALSRLTQGEADSFAGPWSPDGTRIVYTAFGLTTSDIMVINADGTGQVNLTDTPNIDEGFPAWSPDGTHVAFTSRRDGNNEIYVMNADGTNPTRWTDNPADDFAPAWSPDGTQIAFVSDRDREAGIYDLYIMDVVSTEVTRLTNDEAIDYSPAWSPDGTRIAFLSHHDGPGDIYVISVDGTGLTNLTNNPADDWAPTWSPDGMQIAFQTNRDGNWEIYVMNADGTAPTNLSQNPADDQLPFWGR